MSAEWWKEEDGERQLRMETILHQRQNDERESVSSSVVGHQPTMALERATEVQLMRDSHTVASTSIFLMVEKKMSRNTSAHLVTEWQCALVKALQISAASLHLNLLKKALKLKLDWLCSSQSTMSHFWQVITLLSSLRKMFPDSKIAKNFGCARTKATAIVKEGLAPHYVKNLAVSLAPQPFSILMDESNDATNKSCIILVRTLDEKVGDVRTRFLDMPVVNIGTASNLFVAVQKSLADKGLDFSNIIAFMSDNTNVMKGMCSGVQKLVKDKNPHIPDVGCICHLADLVVKAGMKGLPIDIDQLFIDVFYHFYYSSKRTQEFEDNW